MAKVVQVTAADLVAPKPRVQSAMQQRGAKASEDLVPLQFKMPREFVREFKQAALDRNMKLNEFLKVCVHDFLKSGR